MSIDLATAMSALDGRKEFAVRRWRGLVTINYVVQMPGTFDGIRADFRGIVFDEATGRCMSRPLHKFFGVGQTETTQFHRLAGRTATIFEKLDGTMIHWLLAEGELVAATRMGGGTIQADAAADFARRSGMLDAIRAAVDAGWTPIFEHLSPRSPIVVRHPTERLAYLCSRHRESGAYRFDDPFADRAASHEFPFADLMRQLENRRDFEGFVCWLDDGATVKAKCPWYLERHRAFDAMLRPAYKLYGLVFEGVMDDLIASAQPHHKAALERVYTEAQSDLLAEKGRLDALMGRMASAAGPPVPGDRAHRKRFVEVIRAVAPADLGGLMPLYDGREPDDWIKRQLLDGYRARYPDPVVPAGEEDAS